MKWPLLDVQPGGLQSRQALKDARSPSPAHIVVSKKQTNRNLSEFGGKNKAKKKKRTSVGLLYSCLSCSLILEERRKKTRRVPAELGTLWSHADIFFFPSMRISPNAGQLTCVRGSVGVASTLISLCAVSVEKEEVEKSGRRAGQQTGWLAGWTAIGGTGSERTTA